MQTVDKKVLSIAPGDVSPRDASRLFLSVVVPRPIAWVSSMGADGTINLAPFSFFNAIAVNPPTVLIAIGERRGEPKHTLRNIRETGEFVISLADQSLAEAMNQTSGDWEYGQSEFEIAEVAMAASESVKPPWVALAPIAMEVKLTQIIPVAGTTSTLVLGHILRYHIHDGLLRPDGLVDALKLQPLSRLGGEEYASIGKVFSLKRPVVKPL